MQTRSQISKQKSKCHVIFGKLSSDESESDSSSESESRLRQLANSYTKLGGLSKSSRSSIGDRYDEDHHSSPSKALSKKIGFRAYRGGDHREERSFELQKGDSKSPSRPPLKENSCGLSASRPDGKTMDPNFGKQVQEMSKMLTIQLHDENGKMLFGSTFSVDTSKKSTIQLNIFQDSIIGYKSM
ncbi:unnamed protein product [Moneuplotes crassus]|uniref:Uncharacterized protein n=1 Tax=Euplotes crassus TaxID=5936 RepID=A0AAD1XZF0_EUPCR|nr:unnamed protein product [Moneuplotes crassus]